MILTKKFDIFQIKDHCIDYNLNTISLHVIIMLLKTRQHLQQYHF